MNAEHTWRIVVLEQLLAGSKASIVSKLTSQLGISGDQANGFLAKLVPLVEGLVKNGGLDVQKLLAGDASAVTSKLDMSALAAFFGGSVEKAKAGVEVVAKDLAGASGSSGGLADVVGGIAGKLFGKG
jgi:hypothetical protein